MNAKGEVDPRDEAPRAGRSGEEQPGAASVESVASSAVEATPECVLMWIAASGARPWFPSIHAKATGIPRDSLDDPLNALRMADLIRISAWERGVGQGYTTTPAGEEAVKEAAQQANEEPADPAKPEARAATSPVVTHALLVANLIWFTVGLAIAWHIGEPIGSYLVSGDRVVLDRLGAASAESVARGQWWRLISCCFVHIGIGHLFMNMVGLFVVGPFAEMFWGRLRTLAIYFLAGLGGTCLALALRPLDPESGAPVKLAGASGAIWGLMGSLACWLLLYRDRLDREFDAADFTRRLVFAFLLNIAVSLLPGVSWEAHAGGGIVGFAAAGLLGSVRRGGVRRLIAIAILVALPFLCLAGLAAAMRWSDAWAPIRERPDAAKNPAHSANPSLTLLWEVGTGDVDGTIQAAQGWSADQQLVSLINAVSPEALRPVESRAVLMLSKEPGRRRPEEVKELLTQLGALRAAAAEGFRRIAGATGDPAVDARRDRIRSYAEARMRALDLLRSMIESNEVPDVVAWKEWGEARREAEHSWAELIEPAAKRK